MKKKKKFGELGDGQKHAMHGADGKKTGKTVRAGSYNKRKRKDYEDMLKKAGEV